MTVALCQPSRTAPSHTRKPALQPYLPPAAAALLALRPHDCRWPLGQPAEADFRFCATPVMGRGSYCPVHAAMSRGEGAR